MKYSSPNTCSYSPFVTFYQYKLANETVLYYNSVCNGGGKRSNVTGYFADGASASLFQGSLRTVVVPLRRLGPRNRLALPILNSIFQELYCVLFIK